MELLKRMSARTEGYKSKAAVVVLIALAGALAMGYIDSETALVVAVLAEALLGYGIYDKLQRNMKK